MSLTSFLLGLYRWENLGNRSLIAMKRRVDKKLLHAEAHAGGRSHAMNSADKDLKELRDASRDINVELVKRGIFLDPVE